MNARKEDILLLMDRPSETSFMKKGEAFDTTFQLPKDSLTSRYKTIEGEISNRFGSDSRRVIQVKDIRQPNITELEQLGRNELFSLWFPRHRKLAGKLIDIFMGLQNYEDLISFGCYARDRLNPYMFQYALATALLHRRDTKDLRLKSYAEMFPGEFIDSRTFCQLKEEVTVVSETKRIPIIIPREFTASDLKPEHRLWYFREDIGVNLHHWHWHLVYPFELSNRSIVDKDRRGELFYYMHQQIMARYNFERFCNGLNRVERFNDFTKPMKEGYFPKMDSFVAGRAYAPRADNTVLSDLERLSDQIKLDVADLVRWRDRIYEAIHQKFVVNQSGQRVPLIADDSTDTGINTLGNLIEASEVSPNRELYGDLHNFGHIFIGLSHDPKHENLETFGVIGNNTTAMRDPMFYRWHAFIDDMFQTYKEKLVAYTTQQLTFPDIQVQGIQILTQGGQPNTFITFWEESEMNVARGLDFLPHGPILIRFTHLQHQQFHFKIQVNNTSATTKLGMVRVFMAPHFDERGVEMLFRDQRLMMIEIDKFAAQIKPGTNVLRRSSTDSTVTIPYEQTFRSFNQGDPVDGTEAQSSFDFCGCGWPDHMLIPRGTAGGFEADFFVMISDYAQDKVEQDLDGICNNAASYCGIRDRKYPDLRPMGYPFDRVPRAGAERLTTFLTPNMAVQQIKIIHQDVSRRRGRVLDDSVNFQPLVPTEEVSGTFVDYE